MKSLIDIVKEKIKKNIPDSNIEIIDNTHLHKHHINHLIKVKHI